MDQQIKKYILRFILALCMLMIAFVAEKKLISNTNLQISNNYQKVQNIIRDKEVAFIKLFQQQIADTNNIDKKWIELNVISKKENISINIFKNDTLIIWTNNLINSQQYLSRLKTGANFSFSNNGTYFSYFQNVGNYKFVFFYGLRTRYNYQNEYLANHFNDEFSFLGNGVVSPAPITGFYDIKDISRNYLFSVEIFAKDWINNSFLIIFIALSVLAFVITFHQLCFALLKQNILIGSCIFISVMAYVKYSMLKYNLPTFLYKQTLFNPEIYASSNIIPSLGDFILISILVFWFVKLIDSIQTLPNLEENKYKKYSKLMLYSLVCIAAVDSTIDSIKSLVIDSQISFNVKNIYALNSYTYYGLAITILLLITVHLCIKNCFRFTAQNKFNIWFAIAIISIVFFLIHPFIIHQFFERKPMYFGGSILIIVAFVLFNFFFGKSSRFQHFFILVILLSFASASLVTYWTDKKELENRKLYAVKLITQNDITSEYFLKDIEKKIIADKQIKSYFTNPTSLKSQFLKYMRQLYFTGYLSKYDLAVYDFDSAGNHFKERNAYSYFQLNYVLKNQSLETVGKHFRNLKTNTYLKGYLSKFSIYYGKKLVGYIFIQLQPKLIQDENRFDALQIEGYKTNFLKKLDYSYAIYKDKTLVSQSGDYPYSTINARTQRDEEFIQFEEKNYEHLLYNNNQKLTVIVSKKSDVFYEPLGLFSLIFTFFTLLLIILLAIYSFFNSRILKRINFLKINLILKLRTFVNSLLFIKDPDVVLIRTRIQLSIVLIVFITLSFTGYVTINFITNQYNDKQNDKLSRKVRSVVNTMEGEAAVMIKENRSIETEAYINQLADFYDTDISIFNRQGALIASSIKKVYDEGVISNLMDPDAFFHLNFLKESQFSQNEKISNFNFIAAYVPIFKNENELIGYAQLPYFSKQADLHSEISSIIIGFINLYAVLFIVIGFLAYGISHNISYPLILIQKQLGAISLGKKNQPIHWQRNDEIGALVKQYNSMIEKLEESAEKLAQNEREGAWRDIAKQIAHEIKNPLTPMKLSVQHLQRAWGDESPKLEETFQRVSKTLITQIDLLSELANEFSNFAKMPAPENEYIHVKTALNEVINLFIHAENISIAFTCEDEIYIYFDINYFNRVFSNLIKNGIQAVPENRIIEIKIDVVKKENFVSILIKDNGIGISDTDAIKIFTPYFSTKIYGMGLGLPMVKNMVETAGGKITFVSNETEGTVFEVNLPFVDKTDS